MWQILKNVNKDEIECQCTDFNNKIRLLIENNDKSNEIKYNKPWWYSKHLGTLFPFGYDAKLVYEREIISHDSGTNFAVDWFPRKPTNEDIHKAIKQFKENWNVEIETIDDENQNQTPRTEKTNVNTSHSTSIDNVDLFQYLKILIFLPGLGLSSANKFCQNFFKFMSDKHDFFCAVLTHRGVGMKMTSFK